jgi:mannose-6-phosphate isomerase-like protein (cupin superfamily)
LALSHSRGVVHGIGPTLRGDIIRLPRFGGIMAGGRVVRRGEGDRLDVLGDEMRLLAVADTTGRRFDFMIGTMSYLSGPPLHTHRDQDDTFYVLDGVLSVQIGDDVYELEAGDFATAPPGVPHTFGNMHKDQELVRAVNVMTPGGFAEFLTEFSGLPPGPPDAELFPVWQDKYGVSFVGPPLAVRLGLV